MMKTMLGFLAATVVGAGLSDAFVVLPPSLPHAAVIATAVAHKPASARRAGVWRDAAVVVVIRLIPVPEIGKTIMLGTGGRAPNE
ncbi:hypothetical protein [Cupriavidus pauculus]|jgi:hypothetical protein|uniref:hypothetical protein n=1 Tax=Cupriavidus pauculus TaxID=82633 RepID=UPI0030F659EE